MAMLGDLLSDARRSAADVERWLSDGHSGLAARLSRAASAEGESPATFVRIAVADFGRFATEEDWAMLVSRLRDDSGPGTVCLVTMLEWRLSIAEGQQATRPTPEGAAS